MLPKIERQVGKVRSGAKSVDGIPNSIGNFIAMFCCEASEEDARVLFHATCSTMPLQRLICLYVYMVI